MKQKYLFLISFLVVTNMLHAQGSTWTNDFGLSLAQTDYKSKRVIPPSPEAAELGKYGNTPVSLFTGTPQISIPLFELKGNTLSLPISLSYNASGFKPQDVAPWVGLGWSLNAGGVITRSVVGNPDIVGNYFNSSYNYLNIPAVGDLYGKYDYIYNMQKAYMETQPDMYFYNFGNYSGKFLIARDQTVNKKKKDNLKISHCITCGSSTMTTVDENGITYEFDDVEYSTMTLDDGVSSNIPAYMAYNNYPSSWFITSMTSADAQEQILFEYYTTDSLNNLFTNYLSNGSATYYTSTQNGNNTWSASTSTPMAPPTVAVKRKYLKKISLVRGGIVVAYIDFISGLDQRQDLSHTDFPQERLLQTINIYANNALVKRYNLGTSYFVNSTNKRLRLDAVQEQRLDSITPAKPVYSFQYNTGTSVPSYNAASVDHWGFYNNVDNVSTLVPSVTVNGTSLGLGANRNPDLNGSSCAVLNKITYPTGGYTTFEYELHDANLNSVTTSVGGIRIKKITDYSFASTQAIIKNYQYLADDGMNSSGSAGFPTYTKSSTYHYYTVPQLGGNNIPDYDNTYLTISASAVFGLGSVKGSHVGYSKVTETQTDAIGNSLGKIDYRYNIGLKDENNDDASNGALLQQTMYDRFGKMISDQTNTYNYVGTTGTIGYKLITDVAQDNHFVLCYTTGGLYEWHNDWYNYTNCQSTRNYLTKFSFVGYIVSGQDVQLAQQVDKKYDQLSNSYISVTKTFSYGNPAHTFPTLIEQTSSSADKIGTIKKYAGDYTIPGGSLDAATQGIQYLQSKNMVGAEIESIQYRKDQSGSNLRYLGGALTKYNYGVPYPTILYRTELTAPATSFAISTTNGTFSNDASYKLLGTFNYDISGNLIDQTKAQDINKSYYWGYNKTLPIAEAVNAKSNEIFFDGFEEAGTWSSVSIDNTKVHSGQYSGKIYNPTTTAMFYHSNTWLNVTLSAPTKYRYSGWVYSDGPDAKIYFFMKRTGETGYYTYLDVIDMPTTGKWVYVEKEYLVPADATQLNLRLDNYGIGNVWFDDIRLHPSVAQMTTYTYKPFIGITSQSDVNSRPISYEYDGLNRLLNVKDDDGNIVKNYRYNYGLGTALTPSANTLFYNSTAQGTFTRNNCTGGSTPTSVVYTVPAGKYTATTQAAADALATTDVSNNGQAYANVNGQCLFYSALATSFAFKNDCAPTQGTGSKVFYTVPAGTYTSTVSQAVADALATNDVASNKQANANAHGTCSCAAEGQRYINGVCTTGTRFNSSTSQLPNGQWQCIYYYTFSDGYISGNYTSVGSSPCSIQ